GLNRAVYQSHRLARLIGSDELPRIIENLIEEVFAFKDLADQSELQSFFKSNHPARGCKLHRARLADKTGQALRPAHSGNHTEIHLRQSGTACVFLRNAQIAGHGNLQTAADTMAVDRRDDQLRSVFEPG